MSENRKSFSFASLREAALRHSTALTFLIALILLGLSLFYCLFILPLFAGYDKTPNVQQVMKVTKYQDLPSCIRDNLQPYAIHAGGDPQVKELNLQGSLAAQSAVSRANAAFQGMTGEKPAGYEPNIMLVSFTDSTTRMVSDWTSWGLMQQKSVLVLWWSRLGSDYEDVVTHYACLPWYDGTHWDIMDIGMLTQPRYPYDVEQYTNGKAIRPEDWRKILKAQLNTMYAEGFSYTGNTRLTECVDNMVLEVGDTAVKAVCTLKGDVEVVIKLDPVTCRILSVETRKL